MPDRKTRGETETVKTADMSGYKTARDSEEDTDDSGNMMHERYRPMYRNAMRILYNPLFWILAILSPIIIWFILFGLKPGFVTVVDSNGSTVISHQNLLMWTIVFTVIVWIIIYFCFYAAMSSPSWGCRRGKRSSSKRSD